ncbi:hypothetical protein [Caballeronia terrestris]|uniref:hypothetical protein n=1 Tax=Caballeronia terrestris TaxID=1226301 RepID=UPI001F1FB0AC|nr:hypothetical protein [Caballeronia terrestris]
MNDNTVVHAMNPYTKTSVMTSVGLRTSFGRIASKRLRSDERFIAVRVLGEVAAGAEGATWARF